MSAMENSLRRALEAGDANDPAFRESIYAASERALERMLAQKQTSEEAAQQQRARLAETINRVEDDFYERQTAAGAAEDGPAQHDPALSLDPAYADAHAYSTHPAEAGAERSAREEEDDFDLAPVFEPNNGANGGRATAMAVGSRGEAAVAEPIKPSPRARRGGERRSALSGNAPLRRFLALALVVALLLAAGAYVVYGFTGSGGGEAGTAGDPRSISLFEGARLDAVATPNGGRVEALDAAATGVRPAIRFTPAGAAATVTLAVGAGVVATLRGRKAIVELVAGSPDGTMRSFAVECRIAGAGACGRQVFSTLRREETFTFDMDVPSDAETGEIAVTPAASPGGPADLLIYSARLRDGGSPAA